MIFDVGTVPRFVSIFVPTGGMSSIIWGLTDVTRYCLPTFVSLEAIVGMCATNLVCFRSPCTSPFFVAASSPIAAPLAMATAAMEDKTSQSADGVGDGVGLGARQLNSSLSLVLAFTFIKEE